MSKNGRESRIGETVVNKHGQKMTIIDYKNCCDITVQFEDGTILKHKRYNSFIRGVICSYSNRLNEEKLNSVGLKMKIVAYRNSEDIDVQFEDGTIVKSRYKHFIQGRIKNPNEHIGEVYKLRNGTNATILKYNNYYDVTVQLSTGEIVSNVSYRTLMRGSLGKNPKFEQGE